METSKLTQIDPEAVQSLTAIADEDIREAAMNIVLQCGDPAEQRREAGRLLRHAKHHERLGRFGLAGRLVFFQDQIDEKLGKLRPLSRESMKKIVEKQNLSGYHAVQTLQAMDDTIAMLGAPASAAAPIAVDGPDRINGNAPLSLAPAVLYSLERIAAAERDGIFLVEFRDYKVSEVWRLSPAKKTPWYRRLMFWRKS